MKPHPLRDPRWEALVGRHPHSSVFHSGNWLRTLRNVYGYELVVVTTCSPDSPLTNGLLFARVNSRLTGRRLVSLPFSDRRTPAGKAGAAYVDARLHQTESPRGEL